MYSKIESYEHFFTYPMTSGTLGIWLVSHVREEVKIANVSNVASKYVRLPQGDKCVVISMLHTL